MSAVSWNLRITVNEGHLDAFRSLMEEMVASTREEEGTLGYEWFLGDDGTAVHIHERYRDSAAAMVHMGNFGGKFAERFLSMITPQSIYVYGDASAELREAMVAFGAVHMADFGGFSR